MTQDTDSRNEYIYIVIHTNSEILLPWQQPFHDSIFITDLEMDEGRYEPNFYPILKVSFVPAPSELYKTRNSLGSFTLFYGSILWDQSLVSKVIWALSWSAQRSDFSFSWIHKTEISFKISSRTFGNLPLLQQFWKYQGFGGFFSKAFTEQKFFEILQKRTQIFHFLHLNLGLRVSMCYFLAKETVLRHFTFVCALERNRKLISIFTPEKIECFFTWWGAFVHVAEEFLWMIKKLISCAFEKYVSLLLISAGYKAVSFFLAGFWNIQ